MFENGIDIVKVDFHMHTNGDKEFKYDGESDKFISSYGLELSQIIINL